MSAIWAAFYLPVGAQMAVTLSAGVCAAGSAAATQAASNAPASALIAGTTQVANALLDAAAAAVASSGNRRLLLGAAARRGLLEQGLPGDIGDILSQALCAASIALTVCGFLGFVLYAVGAVLAFRCDAMKGTGLWVPKGECERVVRACHLPLVRSIPRLNRHGRCWVCQAYVYGILLAGILGSRALAFPGPGLNAGLHNTTTMHTPLPPSPNKCEGRTYLRPKRTPASLLDLPRRRPHRRAHRGAQGRGCCGAAPELVAPRKAFLWTSTTRVYLLKRWPVLGTRIRTGTSHALAVVCLTKLKSFEAAAMGPRRGCCVARRSDGGKWV
jgi:hypothetical protein